MKAILFDFDGTLLDSADGDRAQKGFFNTARALSLPVGDAHIRKMREIWGTCTAKELIAFCWPKQDSEVFLREWVRRDSDPAHMPPLVRGTRKALGALKRDGYFLAVFTNRDIVSTRRISVARGIWKFWSGIWAMDDLPEGGKANPESAKMVLLGLHRQGIEKSEALFVGDTEIDFRCAQTAGIPFIGVLSGCIAKKEGFHAFGLPENRVLRSVALLPAFLSQKNTREIF